MSEPIPVTKELLFLYFGGQATVLQKEMLKDWLSQPENQDFYFRCRMEWERTHPQYPVDTAAAFQRFQARLGTDGEVSRPVLHETPVAEMYPSRGGYRWLAAAALLAMLSVSAWFTRDEWANRRYETAYAETMRIVLEDGSRVTLNANSSLTVPRWQLPFQDRRVFLQGEAAFSVVHTADDKRFIVESDSGFTVQVLGTEFDMMARPLRKKVVLVKGCVRVDYGQVAGGHTQPLIMTPGDMVTVEKGSHAPTVTRTEAPEAHMAWSQQRFYFENTSLAEISDMISDVYGLRVALDGSELRHETLTGSFQSDSAAELLTAVSKALGITVLRTPRGFILKQQVVDPKMDTKPDSVHSLRLP